MKKKSVTASGERSVAIGGDVSNSVIVTGDKNTITIIKQFVAGMTESAPEYAARIDRFFAEYLGTPAHPVPFGGRETYVAQLDAWLEDDMKPYLLLVAPAGRGKSALLVQWSRRLLSRNDLSVAFVPISIRFRTNLDSVFFVALTARLAALHGEKIPANPNTSPDVWQELMSNYLSRPLADGRRLLLIVDGLDEAAWEGWAHLFPLPPPEGLHIILSTRPLADDTDADGWMRRLGWDHNDLTGSLTLDPLTAEGVADVLRLMRFPLDRLGAQEDIVAELYRLSDGDPLLVRLYVDDLWSRGDTVAHLRPEDLRTIKPGLEGYFNRWWEEQRQLWGNQTPLREPAVQALLNVLACALGPLNAEDILRLVPEESRLSSWMLKEALHPLKRFVIGDGKQQNFVFSHPRLGAYFYEKLAALERQTVESRFLDLGREVCEALNQDRLLPKQASSYFVQYYGAHLERAEQGTEALLSLVSDGWRQAWVALEGSHTGFLNDIAKARSAAERDDEAAIGVGSIAPYVGSEVRCALCQTSINSLAINIPPPLLTALVKSRTWTPAQGLAYARQVPDYEQQVAALAALIPSLPQSKPMLQGFLETVLTFDEDEYRAKLLAELAPHLPKQQRDEVLQKALVSTLAIRYEGLRAEALEALFPHLSEPLLQKALEATLVMENRKLRAEALAKLLPYLPEQRKDEVRQEALVSLQTIGFIDQVEVIVGLSPYLSGQQKDELAQEMLRKVLAIDIEDWKWGIEDLSAILPFLPEQKKDEVTQKALKITLTLVDEDLQPRSLAALAPYLSLSLLQKALKTALAIRVEGIRVWTLAKLIPYFPTHLKGEVVQEALKIAWIMEEDDSDKPALLASLILYLPEQQKNEVVLKILELTKTISEVSRADVLKVLAPHLSEPLLQEALEATQTIEYSKYRSRALGVLAPYLPKSLLQEALEISLAIKDEEDRVRELVKLIAYLPEQQKSEMVWKALEVAQMAADGEPRARSLVALFAGLTNATALSHLSESLLREALQTIRMMKDIRFRAWALANLTSHLNDPLKSEVVLEALETTHAIKDGKSDEDWQVRILSALAPHLSRHLLQLTFRLTRT